MDVNSRLPDGALPGRRSGILTGWRLEDPARGSPQTRELKPELHS